MIAHLQINGTIGNLGMEDENLDLLPYVELEDVMSQFAKAKKLGEVTSVLVHINSPGGSVQVGNDIYDYLLSLKKQGLTVNTISEGLVGSIATKVFLAGDTRTIQGNDEFFIHNPFIEHTGGDASDLRATADDLEKIEDELAKFYAKETGHTIEGIKALMKKETGIKGQEVIDLGFATTYNENSKIEALAFYKKPKKMSKPAAKKQPAKKSIVDQFKAFLNSIGEEGETVNIDYPMPEGATLRIADAENDEMAIGKAAVLVMADGTESPAPEGEHTLADGRTVVIDAEGLLQSISAPVEAESENAKEIAALKAQVEQLMAKLNEKTEKKEEAEKVNVEEVNKVLALSKEKLAEMQKELKAVKEEARNIRTTYNIPEDKKFTTEALKEEENRINGIKERWAEKKKKLEAQNKYKNVKS